MGNTGQARVRFEGSQPILRVENMEASLRFYVDVLGFENVDWGSDEFTSVSRDQAAVYLCRAVRAGRGMGLVSLRLIHGYSRTVGKHNGVRGDYLLTGTCQYGACVLAITRLVS